MYFFYSFVLTVGALIGLPYGLYKAFRERKYLNSFRQRLGFNLPDLSLREKPLWIHSVSAGEVLAAKPILLSLQRLRPELPIVLSTVTLTGEALARKEFARSASVFYFPFDWRFSVNRFLAKVRPRAVLVMETELWPNFIRGCTQHGIPVFLANARISDRSWRNYRRVRMVVRQMLSEIRIIGAQSHEDKRRFLSLGATDEQVRVTGNLKFDFPVPTLEQHTMLLTRLKSSLAVDSEAAIIVVGSSMKGEEPLFLEAFYHVRQAIPNARMILAPRHPERFSEVSELLRRSGLRFLHRSELENPCDQPADIVLLDSIGELRAVYSLATVAVIGGSFLPHGGHNLLEPAAFGKAIVFGPEMSNFKELARLFLHEQAAREASPQSLPPALIELLRNARARNILGQRAASTFRQNQGATDKTMDFLLAGIP